MWNRLRKLFKHKKPHVIRASRSKLLLNKEEEYFCDIVAELTILTGSSKKAVEEAAARMALSRQVAKEWFGKPKIQQGIAAAMTELRETDNKTTAANVCRHCYRRDCDGGCLANVSQTVRILPAD